MQRRYPKIAAHEDRIFMIDGPTWTSAGMSAGIDLALALLAGDLGSDLARVVAKILVVYHRRAWGAGAVLDVVGSGRGIRSYPRRARLREITFERAIVGSGIGSRF
jgi:transcriptional regulator GlxA family with amidase domain